MTENRSARHSHERSDPSYPTGQVASAAVRSSGEVIVADLADDLRVRADDRQWILEYRQSGGKTWRSLSFCATKEGLVLRIKEFLLERHLTRLDYFQARKIQVRDRTGKLVWRRVVSREALDETERARGVLRRGDVADMESFGVDAAAWVTVAKLPDYFKVEG